MFPWVVATPMVGASTTGVSMIGASTTGACVTGTSARGGTSINYWQQGGAAGVHMQAGILRESLIAYNTTKSDNFGSAVYCKVNGGQNDILIENCTIAGNHPEDDNWESYTLVCCCRYTFVLLCEKNFFC